MYQAMFFFLSGTLFGFFGLFTVVALCIKSDDKSSLREVTGSFLEDLAWTIHKPKTDTSEN